MCQGEVPGTVNWGTRRQGLKAHIPDNEEKHTGAHTPTEVRASGISMWEASMSLNLELKKKKGSYV